MRLVKGDLRIGSLFSGSGMLDEAVRSVIGGTVAWHSDIEPASVRLLEHRYPDVPNLGDITTVDWSSVEPVDVLTGGFPCQDLSAAGRRLGLRPGTRSGLWEHMAFAVSVLRPKLVVIENVRGLLSAEAHSDLEPCPWCLGDGERGDVLRALGAVLGDLANLGYVGSWRGVRASDVGAPHDRFRVFIVARPASDSGRILDGDRRPSVHADSGRRDGGWGVDEGSSPSAELEDDGATVADPGYGDVSERSRQARRPTGKRAPERVGPGRGRGAVADPDGYGSCGNEGRLLGGLPASDAAGGIGVDWGKYRPAVRRWERIVGRAAPVPAEPNGNGKPRLTAALPEWMMGWPEGWVTQVPGLTRTDMLKIAGNGVCPQQAAYALRLMGLG